MYLQSGFARSAPLQYPVKMAASRHDAFRVYICAFPNPRNAVGGSDRPVRRYNVALIARPGNSGAAQKG